jgi:capsular exopolysaccharide synthesis family protein
VQPLPQAATTGPSEIPIDLRYYIDIVWRGRALIAAAAAAGLSLGLLVGFLQTPQYQAAALLQIEPPTPAFVSVSDALVGGGGYFQNTDFYNTQFKILRSRGVAEGVVQRLKLGDRSPFKEGDPAGTFLAHVEIDPVPESRLVRVLVTDEDPKEAALWANTLSAVYIEQTLATRVQAAKQAYDWLQERLAATQEAMRLARSKLISSYQGQDLFVPEGSVSAVTTSITKLNDDYLAARMRRISLEAALKQVEDKRRRGESLETVPQIATDAMVGSMNEQLGALSLQLSQLREKYKEGHPELQKARAQIAELRKTREARFGQIVDALRAEYAQLERRESEFRSAIEGQKSQAATQSRKASELEILKKEEHSANSLYDVLLQKVNETDIASSIRNNNVSIVETAAPPASPVRPAKKRIAALALALGLALGIGLVIAREYLDNTIKGPEDIERFLHLDLLAAVPKYDEANVHLVTEAYQNLRTALIFGRREETGQVVLITGTAPQEGKTTTLVNIAKLLASSGEKAVAVDFDLRRAQLHARLGLTREPGITDFFVRHADLDSLIRPTRVPNLFVLTAGPLPPNPPAILARKQMADFLNHLRRHFDWILVDAPPVASVTDALLLARHADIVVYVVEHNKIDKKLIKRSVNALRKVTPNVLGAVLNAVDIKSKGYYYYYYPHTPGSESRPAKPRPKPVVAVKK